MFLPPWNIAYCQKQIDSAFGWKDKKGYPKQMKLGNKQISAGQSKFKLKLVKRVKQDCIQVEENNTWREHYNLKNKYVTEHMLTHFYKQILCVKINNTTQ